MKSILFFLIFSIGYISSAHADGIANLIHQGSTFKSASLLASAAVLEGVKGFKVLLNGKEIYRSAPPNDYLKYGKLLISDDGEIVIWHLTGRFLSNANQRGQKNIPALIFYLKGTEIKRYSLNELLVRQNLVSYSVSHTRWISKDENRYQADGFSFYPDASRLSFQTTSFRHYVFNPRTGQMISSKDTEIYKKADLIVHGKLKPADLLNTDKKHPHIFQIVSPRIIKGEKSMKGLIVFMDPTKTFRASSTSNVALKKGPKGILIAIAPRDEIPTFYNALKR